MRTAILPALPTAEPSMSHRMRYQRSRLVLLLLAAILLGLSFAAAGAITRTVALLMHTFFR
jgi:hypothetical protein